MRSGGMSPASVLAPPASLHTTASAAVSWFAIWTRSRHEAMVRRQLEAKGIDAYLPTFGRWSYWKDRRKRIEWPLFPGYCFARFPLTDTLPVLSCGGVVSLVSFQGRPTPIPDHEIEGVRRLVESELKLDPCPMLREGSPVEVVRGPLRGVVGRLMRKGARARLVVSVGLIGQGVMVDVDAADVRAY